MNAKELNVLFEKYKIGHIKLERPFWKDDNSPEIHAIVVNDNGDPIGSTDKWHFNTIEINDNTFGFESENEICDKDYEDFEICDLQFYTQSWAYPNAYIDEIGGTLEVAESNCGIRLTNHKEFANLKSNIDLYTEQAIKMFLDPLKYQNWLLNMFLDEQTNFIKKHYPMMKEMGYWMAESGLYKRGFETEYTSEIYIEFKTITEQSNLYIHQNLFTGKWVIQTSEVKKNAQKFETPYLYYEYNINDLSCESLKKIILDKFETKNEMFWREEQEYRKKCIAENKPYSLDLFIEYKSGKTIDELKSEIVSNVNES